MAAVKRYDWNEEKNELLNRERGVAFEQVVSQLERGGLLDLIQHPNEQRYPGQKIYIVNINNYAYVVPFVEHGDEAFLKTIIPSRKMTRKYLKR